MTAKKCTKKRDAHAKLLFCQSKPPASLPSSLTSLSSLLKLPIVGQQLPTLLDVTRADKGYPPWMLHVASVCTYCCMLLRVVGRSCCAKFETGQTFSHVQTDVTTPNVVGPTMFGVVYT